MGAFLPFWFYHVCSFFCLVPLLVVGIHSRYSFLGVILVFLLCPLILLFIIAINFVILVVNFVVERVVQVCFVILFCLIFFVVGYTILIFPLVPGSWFRVFEVLEFILVPIFRSLATAPLFFVLPFVLLVIAIPPYRWHVGLLTVLVSICHFLSIQLLQVPY